MKMRGKLAIAIGETDLDSLQSALGEAARVADLAEVRLDYLAPADLETPRLWSLLEASSLPLVITHRPAREGGRFDGDEARRLAVLRRAIEAGVSFVDLEWDTAVAFLASLPHSLSRHYLSRPVNHESGEGVQGRKTRIIVSKHRYDSMPDDLGEMAAEFVRQGADVVKLVGTAQRLLDNLPILRLLNEATVPTIAIAMGKVGRISRVLAPAYPKALLTYGALAASRAVASGQLSAQELRGAYRVDDLTLKTPLVGLIGRDPESIGRLARGLNEATPQPDEASPLYLPFCVGDDASRSKEIARAFLGAPTGLNLVGVIAADASNAFSSEDLARIVLSAKEASNLDEELARLIEALNERMSAD